MTETEVQAVLKDPSTHKLVHQVLQLASQCDIVDAYRDVETALEIIEYRLDSFMRKASTITDRFRPMTW
jgi:predicted CoA-binding protein